MAIATSQNFKLPVPKFALQVRELQIEKIRRFDSHSFILGRTITDENLADDLQLFVGHSFYERWRQQALPSPHSAID